MKIQKLFRYIKTIVLKGPMIIYYHFRYMIPFSKHPEKYDFNYRYQIARKEIRSVLDCLKVEYKINNIDTFINSKEKSLLISNHLSFADPLVLIANSEKPITFIAKEETFDFPFVRKVAKALEVFPLDRKNLMNQINQIREVVNYLKDSSKPPVIVYIEGTRNKQPENPCLDFHPGTLKIALMSNVPIITVATYGTFRVLDKNSYIKRNLTQITFLNKYVPSDLKEKTTNELAIELKNEIDREVDEQRKIDYKFLTELKLKNKIMQIESRCDSRIKS